MEGTTAVALRLRYSAEVWKERIASCRTSGQTVTAWCEANAINSKSYYRWERKLLAETRPKQAIIPSEQGCFAEIAPISQKQCPSAVVLRGNGVTCEISNEITPGLLGVILAALIDHA